MSDRDVAFRGHIEECLAHLNRSLEQRAAGRRRDVLAAERSIARFCGVQVQTVIRWRGAKHLPVGDQYFRLICYLDVAGYSVVELDRITGGNRFAAELIGYGILTGQELATQVGYQVSTLYKVLRGAEGTSRAKADRIWAIGMEYQGQLKRQKENAKALWAGFSQDRSTPTDSSVKSKTISCAAETLLLLVQDMALDELSQNKKLVELAATLNSLVLEGGM